jgi:hypothetical protein
MSFLMAAELSCTNLMSSMTWVMKQLLINFLVYTKI